MDVPDVEMMISIAEERAKELGVTLEYYFDEFML
tara:strand:+ start:105 stop:206 length:102 start_codon:yes stop_codon:yes gene_type:complete